MEKEAWMSAAGDSRPDAADDRMRCRWPKRVASALRPFGWSMIAAMGVGDVDVAE